MSASAKKGTHEPVWQLREAKARLSEVVRRAVDDGPQHVSIRGKPAAVVLSEKEYRQLTSKRPSIVDHILAGEPWPMIWSRRSMTGRIGRTAALNSDVPG
jgi:prevent-host-death family protein